MNNVAGHAFPTGSNFNRQCWLDLEVRDATDRLLFASGTLDDNGDLFDAFGDAARRDRMLVTFGRQLLDQNGDPALFPWRAQSAAESTAIPAAGSRTFVYSLAIDQEARLPVRIDASLRFRTYAPRALRELGRDELIAQLRIFDVDARSLSVASR